MTISYFVLGNLRQCISEVKDVETGARLVEKYNREDKNWGIYTPHYYNVVRRKNKNFDLFMHKGSYTVESLPRYQLSNMIKANNGAGDDEEEFIKEPHTPDLTTQTVYNKVDSGEKRKQAREDMAYAKIYEKVPLYSVWDSVEEKDVEIAGFPFVTLDKAEAELLLNELNKGALDQELQ